MRGGLHVLEQGLLVTAGGSVLNFSCPFAIVYSVFTKIKVWTEHSR